MAIQPRILVVDDHHDTVDLLVQLMVGFEYRAIGAESFREALVVAAAKPFDLYILDLELPDGDGCDLLHQLHAQRAAPAIAITGLGLPEDHERRRRRVRRSSSQALRLRGPSASDGARPRRRSIVAYGLNPRRNDRLTEITDALRHE